MLNTMDSKRSVNLKSRLKNLVENLTNSHIYSTLPRGIDLFRDISISLKVYNPDIVFDVGANVGQTVSLFLRMFPGSRIYCFEPVTDTFLRLQNNLNGNDRVECYRLALGSSKRMGKMVVQGSDKMFFVLGQSQGPTINHNALTETVNIIKLDDFCQEKGVNHISYLKIDTEGGDLDVLNGAVNMLTEQKIDLVQVEAGMNPINSHHVSFETLKTFLESYQYYLFGVYEQVNEWPTGKPHLRRSDTLFISNNMIERNVHLPESIG